MVLTPSRDSTDPPAEAIAALRSALQGSLVRPADAEYDAARQVWNACFDRRPALIVRAASTGDVVAAVNFAHTHGLPLAVRGGGHSLAGYGTCDAGLVLDLRGMNKVAVDAEARVAHAGGGVIGREFGAATLAHGLATPTGQVPTTGLAGVALGGGVGWLTRKYGLTCDSLLSAEVVTADGQVLQVSESAHPDLFWALRGGSGNFGVVTAMEFRLYPVQMVVGGVVFHPMAEAERLLRFYRDFAAGAPDELTSALMFMSVPPVPMLPAALHGQPAVGIVVCYAGPVEQGMGVVAPLKGFGSPLADLISPMPFAVVQALGEAGGRPGFQHDVYSGYLRSLDDAAIAAFAAQATALPGPLAQVHLLQQGGAAARVAPEATAYPHRADAFMFNILPTWAAPGEAEAQRRWMRTLADALAPVASDAVYVNFLGEGDAPERTRAAYGANWERLVAVKHRYDPNNLFRVNANVAVE